MDGDRKSIVVEPLIYKNNVHNREIWMLSKDLHTQLSDAIIAICKGIGLLQYSRYYREIACGQSFWQHQLIENKTIFVVNRYNSR